MCSSTASKNTPVAALLVCHCLSLDYGLILLAWLATSSLLILRSLQIESILADCPVCLCALPVPAALPDAAPHLV